MHSADAMQSIETIQNRQVEGSTLNVCLTSKATLIKVHR